VVDGRELQIAPRIIAAAMTGPATDQAIVSLTPLGRPYASRSLLCE